MGIDLNGTAESQVAAIEDGKVVSIYPGSGEKVSYIKIGNIKYMHVKVYGHIKEGTDVKAGDIIGTLDDTGKYAKPDPKWTGWHLHFQIGDGEKNPIEYLMNSQPDLIWDFLTPDNQQYVINKYPNLYNKMKKGEPEVLKKK